MTPLITPTMNTLPASFEVVCQSIQWPALEVQSLPIRLSPLDVKTTGFIFPEAPTWQPPQAVAKSHAGTDRQSNANGVKNIAEFTPKAPPKKRATLTRIRPPADVIKLKDRLYYLLQPPLESIVGTANLTFPFEPFPYQFDGIAFLFSRYAAILADEMGLGKTMQSISSIRLLLCSGELRSVLLICPKPLVTNWQREFRTWAPEIPVTVIEGDSAKRYWQWRHPGAPVKIANYELLMRDKELLLEGLAISISSCWMKHSGSRIEITPQVKLSAVSRALGLGL